MTGTNYIYYLNCLWIICNMICNSSNLYEVVKCLAEIKIPIIGVIYEKILPNKDTVLFIYPEAYNHLILGENVFRFFYF